MEGHQDGQGLEHLPGFSLEMRWLWGGGLITASVT